MNTIITNFDEFEKGLDAFQKKQLPYTKMLTANNLAFDFLKTHKKEVSDELNWKKKTPNAIKIKKATKSRQYAEVFVDEWNWGYYALKQHYTGGDRHRKGMEKAMIRAGYMHKNEILTPSPGVSVKASTYVKMLSQLKLFDKAGFSANETKSSRIRKAKSGRKDLRFFVITGKSKSPLAPGIYARMIGYDKPVCILRISEKPEYKKKFDMLKTMHKVYQDRGQTHFNKAFAHAMSTAK